MGLRSIRQRKLLLRLADETPRQHVTKELCSHVQHMRARLDVMHHEVRYDLAQRYVRNPEYSVGQIASMLGYNSHSAFTRWFSTLFGCPPEVWREKNLPPGKLQRTEIINRA